MLSELFLLQLDCSFDDKCHICYLPDSETYDFSNHESGDSEWGEFESDCESDLEPADYASMTLEEFNQAMAERDARAAERKAKRRVLIEKKFIKDPQNWRHYNSILNDSSKLLALLLGRIDGLKRRYCQGGLSYGGLTSETLRS